jgi:hypothetical protein
MLLIRKVSLLNVLLLGLCVFVATQIYGIWNSEEKAVKSRSQFGNEDKGKVEKPDEREIHPEPKEDGQGIDLIINQDLFQEDRKRPAAQAVTSPALASLPALNAALFGIFEDEQGARALIQDQSSPGAKPRWFRAGESIGEFTLVKIDETQVELQGQGTKRVLVVFENARPRPPQQTAPAQQRLSRRDSGPPPASPTVQPAPTPQRESLLNRLREARRERSEESRSAPERERSLSPRRDVLRNLLRPDQVEQKEEE